MFRGQNLNENLLSRLFQGNYLKVSLAENDEGYELPKTNSF